MPSLRLSVLDVYAPAVREVISRSAPETFALRFAESYDEHEQRGLAEEADFLLAGWAQIDAAMIAAAKRLRMVQKWGIGVDRIDVEALRRAGIPLAITAGANAGPVAEHAIMLMLSVLRRLPVVDRALREGRWLKSEMRATALQLSGKTVGLVGFGNIGRTVALKLAGFDCRILYYDPRPLDRATERAFRVRQASLDQLFAESDVVSLHLPATAETMGLVDGARLQAMKKGAVLINTARGELVDEAALHRALTEGPLSGAGLDAFAQEPPEAGNPLLSLDNVVVTPHVGGAAFDNVENTARHALGNLLAFVEGRPLSPLDIVVPPLPR